MDSGAKVQAPSGDISILGRAASGALVAWVAFQQAYFGGAFWCGCGFNKRAFTNAARSFNT